MESVEDVHPSPASAPTYNDALGDALSAMITPALSEVNGAVQEVFRSQNALEKQLEILSGVLEKFLEHSPPEVLGDRLKRLTEAKERMEIVNGTLERIQGRLETLYAQYSPQ